ncbi:MAG: hypothetical protein BWX80_00151 [Candidatus Hydrogenedentes bacterium ADurb.Bin101]|nr:MAG: hypothetical protein BWX80_00151 [Candidatus Hydrogenedentes bacterium ADurb.Bin101]
MQRYTEGGAVKLYFATLGHYFTHMFILEAGEGNAISGERAFPNTDLERVKCIIERESTIYFICLL